MYIIVNRKGEIIGSSDVLVDLEDLATRQETSVFCDLNLPLNQLEVTGFPENPIVQAKAAPEPLLTLLLVSSAEDNDGDGFPELPADGKSQTTIGVFLRNSKGQPVLDPVEVHFRTSAGALSHRKVIARGGKADIKLTASQDTVMANVRVSAKGFEAAELTFEFLPPSEVQPSAPA
jgi:hypothetical protein